MVSEVDGMALVNVQEGEFEMGSEDGDNDERPVHMVYLDAFWIDRTEITNDQIRQCYEQGGCVYGPSRSGNDKKDHPTVYIGWFEAEAYCAWAGRRLPTEAEWEKAARGTNGRTYPWGEEIDCNLANYNGCVSDTNQVGSYPDGASLYGALDMAGNVWEWVADWYSETYYASSPTENPTGPDSGTHRVLRGGSWGSSVRSTDRYGLTPSKNGSSSGGFRCAMSVSP